MTYDTTSYFPSKVDDYLIIQGPQIDDEDTLKQFHSDIRHNDYDAAVADLSDVDFAVVSAELFNMFQNRIRATQVYLTQSDEVPYTLAYGDTEPSTTGTNQIIWVGGEIDET